MRIVAADDFQGAADALNAQGLKLTKIYVLNDKEAYGQGVATNFSNAAKQLGLNVVGFTSWDGKASSYQGLATQIKQSGADAVFIGGLVCENGGKLVKDLRATLGTGVTLLAPDGFTPVSAVVQGAGTAAERHVHQRRRRPERAARPGGPDVREGLRRDAVRRHGRPVLDVCRAGGLGAARLDRSSDGTRAGVASQLLTAKVVNGLLGTFSINKNGDTTSNPVTQYKVVNGASTTYKVITPPLSLVHVS